MNSRAAKTQTAILAEALAEAAQALLKAAGALLGGAPLEGNAPATIIPFQPFQPNRAGAPRPHESPALREVINEFLVVKARADRSDRYLRQLRVSLSSFAAGRALIPISEITLGEVEKWVFSLTGKDGETARPKTMRNYLGDVQTLFNFAMRRGYVAPALREALKAVELPESDTKKIAPCIHTPAEVRTILEHLRGVDIDVMRNLAVRYFAGIRSAETHRLSEEHIKRDQVTKKTPHGVIEVPTELAKTRSRRLVTIQPCLAAWLDLGGTLRKMGPDNVREKIRLAGVEWKHNAARHSFVSYHYAKFDDAKLTAKEAGHTEEMLFSKYRALVPESAAEEFFAIFPER